MGDSEKRAADSSDDFIAKIQAKLTGRAQVFINKYSDEYPFNSDASTAPSSSKDQILLNQTYAIIVEVVLEVLPIYAATLSCKQAQSKAYKLAQDRCALIGLDVDTSKVSFTIEVLNNHAQSLPLVEGKSCPYVKMISLSVYDIPSSEHPGHSLGSVSFAESFLDSTIHTVDKGKEGINGQYTVLTAHIPRYTAWMISQHEIEASQKTMQFLKSPESLQFGKALVHGATVDIWSRSNLANNQEVALHIFEEAIMMVDSRFGCFCLPKHALTNMQFYDGDSTSAVALLILNYSPSVRPTIPYHLDSDDCQLIIVFSPKTKAYKEFFSDVLHFWRKQEGSIMQIIEELPNNLKVCHAQLQRKFQIFSHASSQVSSLKKAEMYLPDLQRFLDHLAVSSVCDEAMPKSDLPILLKEPFDQGSFESSDELVVTVISGVVGSFREELAQTLTNLNKEQHRWMVIKHPADNVELFDPVGLQNTLTSAVQALKKKSTRSGTGRKRMRALVVTPGFTDIVPVVSCILNHPDVETSKHLKIGSITVCVDPLNMFMENRMTLPKLLDQCAQGWVDNILFTGSTNLKNQALLEAQHLIRAVNANAAFLLADRGQVTRSPDIELILSDSEFMENDKVRARFLSCPCWKTKNFASSDSFPRMTEICVRFPQPLEKNKFTSKLRALRTTLRSQPYSGNIYAVRAITTMSDAPDKKIEIHFITLSNTLLMSAMDVQPRPPSSGDNGLPKQEYNSVVFTGCDLEESKLREWLRICGKQKPEKKALRTRSSLSAAELKNVETKHHLDALPEGWFYNGNQYVSMMGDRQAKHPNLDQHLAAYIEEMNKLIAENNAKIDELDYPDLFQE